MSTVDLSLVVEMETKDITGAYDYQASLREWLRQIQAIAPHTAEVILCHPGEANSFPEIEFPCPLRKLHLPGKHYYAIKNASANVAQGKVVLFTDSDCRPGEGYLENLLRIFDDPQIHCVAGRSLYDGTGILTRINTTVSFGRFHFGPQLPSSFVPLAHNVAVRRSCYQRDPFGPFTGRVLGDVYLSETLRQKNFPPILRRELVMYHEDMTFSLRGTLERHLRDHFYILGKKPPATRTSAWSVLRATLASPRRRLQKVRLYGPSLGLRRRHLPIILAVLVAYAVFDSIAVSLVLGVPSWRRHWLKHEFGEPLASQLLR